MGSTLSTLYAILMTENAFPKTQSMINQSFSPRIHKHFNNVPRSSTNKNMRRNHQIKQPGFDVQRNQKNQMNQRNQNKNHVTLGNHCNRKR